MSHTASLPEEGHQAAVSGEGFDPESIRTSYLALFYSVLFHPVRTFRSLVGENPPGGRLLFYALTSVLLISIINPIIGLASLGGDPATLIVAAPLSAVGGLFIWGFSSLAVSLLHYAFTGQNQLRTFLVLSGLATLPWILMGPISLLKVGIGIIGLTISAIFGLIVWLWSVLLFGLAIINAFRLPAERVLILFGAPFVGALILLGWLLGFLGNIRLLSPP